LNFNITGTTTINFSLGSLPSVFNLVPTAGSIFNQSDIIEIAANVTDSVSIDTVRANITLPNGSFVLIVLTNSSTQPDIFNSSYTIELGGTYSVVYLANNSEGGLSSDNTTSFEVNVDFTYFNGFLPVSSYLTGTLDNINFDLTSLQILSGIQGNYTSDIFNAGSAEIWYNITWDFGQPYDLELPDEQGIETHYLSGNANMSQNILLFHFNNDSALGENDTHIYDSSGLGNNGTAISGINFTIGKLNRGIEFTGEVGLNISDSASLNFTNQFTASFWAKNIFGLNTPVNFTANYTLTESTGTYNAFSCTDNPTSGNDDSMYTYTLGFNMTYFGNVINSTDSVYMDTMVD